MEFQNVYPISFPSPSYPPPASPHYVDSCALPAMYARDDKKYSTLHQHSTELHSSHREHGLSQFARSRRESQTQRGNHQRRFERGKDLYRRSPWGGPRPSINGERLTLESERWSCPMQVCYYSCSLDELDIGIPPDYYPLDSSTWLYRMRSDSRQRR